MDTQNGELLSILGHNGAGIHNIIIYNSICNEGKSTLIGVLTGCFQPTGGTAEIDGLDIRFDSDEVTKNIELDIATLIDKKINGCVPST